MTFRVKGNQDRPELKSDGKRQMQWIKCAIALSVVATFVLIGCFGYASKDVHLGDALNTREITEVTFIAASLGTALGLTITLCRKENLYNNADLQMFRHLKTMRAEGTTSSASLTETNRLNRSTIKKRENTEPPHR